MMKNTFDLMLIVLFVLEIFIFLSLLFGYVENSSVRKLGLISKFTRHRLDNRQLQRTYYQKMSRNKSNQAMKFWSVSKI